MERALTGCAPVASSMDKLLDTNCPESGHGSCRRCRARCDTRSLSLDVWIRFRPCDGRFALIRAITKIVSFE